MKVWNAFPMMRLLPPFLAGVVSWAFFLEVWSISLDLMLIGFGLGCISFLLIVVFGRYDRKPHLFGILCWPLLYLIGALLTISVSDHIYPDHLKHVEFQESQEVYMAEIVDEPQTKENSIKVVAQVTDADCRSFGKVLLYFKKDSLSSQLKYGNQVLMRTELQPVVAQGNPSEFNYARYLRFHHIGHRGYVKEQDWKMLSVGEPSVFGTSLSIRSHLIGLMEKAGLSGNELAVASALVLGHRADIDSELLTAYAGSGATHVLSVSGLHVGIMYVVFNFLLKFLDRSRFQRFLRAFLAILFLFGYAALTGLSPSVLRATVMFSFVAIGNAIDRNTNIYNTLASSAFLLILYEPLMVMQVGFQLSYAAVFGIVLVQPRLFSLFTFNNRLVDWAWSISCVSVAAQIPTFPLGLLYFHQFPNLFLVSNILVIPAATAILYLGLLLFVFSFWEQSLLFFGFLLKWLIIALNQVVVWIEKIPYAVLTGIDISIAETIMIYGIIIAILVFVINRKPVGLYLSLALSVVFLTMQILEFEQQRTQQFVTAYNVRGETVIGLVKGREVTLIASEQFWRSEQAMLFHVRHHWWNKGVLKESFVELNDSLVNRRLEWGGTSFAILDLPRNNQRGSWTVNTDSLDVAFVHQMGWNNLEALGRVSAKQVIVSNTVGKGTATKLKEYVSVPAYMVSGIGAVTVY